MSHGTALTPFEYSGHPVRTVHVDGVPMIHHADVCAVLEHTNPSVAIRLVEEDDRQKVDMRNIAGQTALNTPATGNAEAWFITESGFYDLVFASKAPGAKAFKRWVTHEVLPALRRTGRYAVAEPTRADLARMVLAAEAEREALEQQVAELAPKAAAVDEYMDAYGLELIGTVAKMLHVRERVLRRFLFDQHILIEHGERRNDPMAEYVDCGYFEVKTRVVGRTGRGLAARTTFVTPRGVEFIRRRLVAAGIVSGGGQQFVLA